MKARWVWVNMDNYAECDGPFRSQAAAKAAALSVFPELDYATVAICEIKEVGKIDAEVKWKDVT